jgi:hypothetical protein
MCERHDMITAISDIAIYEVTGSERVFMETNRIWLPWYMNATCCGIARLSRSESRSDEGIG